MSRTRHVLSVASECAPLLKTGGLADVVGALPAALAPYGWASRVLLPGYPAVLDKIRGGARDKVRDGKTGTTIEPVWQTDDLFGGPAAVLPSRQAGLDLLVLDAPHLFDRAGGPYGVDGQDHPDNHVRFAALSWVGAQLAVEGAAEPDGVWRPDLVHVHDWQAGLVPSYLRYAGADIPTVMSIHNIAFQGVFGADQLDRLKLPTWDFHPESLEYHGLVSSLKAGMVHSDLLTTVSPTYAEELATPEFGFGLEGVVAARRDRGQMAGILNGIDTTVWDPAADPHVVPYSAQDQSGKQEARRALLDEFDLPVPEGPLAVVVTRLTHQKGVDLLLDALPSFIDDGGAVVVLGSGDQAYERGLLELQDAHPRSVAVRIGYDEPLSHRMYAGGDLVLVPSRFEPCGLTQMYGQRYGAVPLVAATGGLRDTVTDATPESLTDGTATGFTFGDASLGGTVDAGGLRFALGRAVDLYADPEAWARLRTQAMLTPVDWSTSASRYAGLFATLLE